MSNFGGILISSLSVLLTSLPLLITWIVGIIIAIVRWKKAPRRSLLALIALVIFMGMHILSAVFNSSFFLIASDNGMDYQAISSVSVIVNIVFGLVDVAGWVLVLLAIFGKPKKAMTGG